MNEIKEGFVQSESLTMHYLQIGDEGPNMLLLHSLSGNAHIYSGLIARGLGDSFRLTIPDLRGRGESEKPTGGYTLEQESRDLLGLLDALGIERTIVCGHSFGALLGVYFAAHYPERVSRLIILDAAVELNPLTPALINYATVRMLHPSPSLQAYIELVRRAPFMNRWDEAMIPFIKADVIEAPDGTVFPRNRWTDILQAATHVLSIPTATWRTWFGAVAQPALLLRASEPFVHGQFLVEADCALQSAVLLRRGELMDVSGNHITMLFSDGAGQIVNLISQFCVARGPSEESVEQLSQVAEEEMLEDEWQR